MYSRVIVAPPVEPVSLAEVKLDRAVDHTLHDDLLGSLIRAARDYVEEYCGISLVTQTREVGFDNFSSQLQLPYGPVQEIVSVSYQDATNLPIELLASEYQLNITGGVIGRISAALGSPWPTTVAAFNVVSVRYIAGYAPLVGSPTDYVGNIPGAIKQAMRLLIGTWYENRESTIVGTISSELPMGITALLSPYRVRTGMA